jgi:tryptophanyl-tRNA synthetase
MSKSYNNAINLSDSEEEVKRKILQMFTDPARIKLSDPGHPKKCNVYSYYEVFVPERAPEVYHWCTRAERGCTECKTILVGHLLKIMEPIQDKRRGLLKDKKRVADILEDGRAKAQAIASKTIQEVKDIVF